MKSGESRNASLLLLGGAIGNLGGDDLTKHDNTVAIQESDTGETFAILEGVDDERLARLELDLGHLVGLEGMWLFSLLATGLLAHLPVEVDDTAGRATATDEADRGVTLLDLARDIQDLDLGGEVGDVLQGGVLLVDHDITGAWHVLLDETLDVQTDVVTWKGLLGALVMHFDGENLADASIGWGVGRHEDDFLTWLDDTLLDTSGQDITDTLDLVDSADRHTHWLVGVTLWWAGHVVEGIQQAVDVELLTVALDVHTGPPGHVGGLGQQVVTHPSGDRDDRDGLLNEVLLPANLAKHVLHLVGNLGVAVLLVASGVAIHLVNSDNELLDTEQVNQTAVLTGLALDFGGLVVTTLDGGDEVTVSWNHKESDVSLGGTGNHVLDEITMAWGINDGVVPLLSEELLGGAGDGDTTLTLLLLTVHIEGEGEGRLTETLGFLLELLKLTLWDTAELEEQTAGGGGLAGVDMSADNERQMFLTLSHGKI